MSGSAIGNDVVDLDDPETSVEELNPRFDQRVFTAAELRRLSVADDKRALRWTLWAAKESAFKLAKRLDPETVFAHSLFETDLDERGYGTVRHGKWCCAVTVGRKGPAVHAISTLNRSDREWVVSDLAYVEEGDDPSARVRELATNSVAQSLVVEPGAVTITAGDDRIPVLRVDGQPQGHLSLSHHGALTAFAWMPPPERSG
jgi:phosphopantetheinyl transferase (holo-ACP synthase)